MSPVEIADAVAELAEGPFDPGEFPFAFLLAFGNKEATIARLRKSSANKSDCGGMLQPNNIHIKVCATGAVAATLDELRASPATAKARAKFILATDGEQIEAEDLSLGDTVACTYRQLDDHLGFFLPLAGISTVKQIRENAFDIKATGRLNKLYVQLLKDNPDWASADRRPDMNHFMARLIFCFFAEDTGIFHASFPFTATVMKMSQGDEASTQAVIETIFTAMNVPTRHEGQLDERHRKAAGIPGWANPFPYVNGGLFSGSAEVPRFTRIARAYFNRIGGLDWTEINPDIFGSMIQAIADDDERGALGMHYTSVPNILKVLNPLFLDDLRAKLEEAGDNGRKLFNLRNRMARIRVFDPACGSGNFLVIAYKAMREIEAEINKRRGEHDYRTEIPLTNFRGIELRDFPAEVARLALIIAEYQCDVLYRGQKEALAEFLPLNSENWITCGNALRLDWLSICEPTGKGGGKIFADDLYGAPLDQAKIEFANEGGETYICGNPPYVGDKKQSANQKTEIENIFSAETKRWKSFDYICGFFKKASDFVCSMPGSSAAFVSTNSITQGVQVSEFWPLVLEKSVISFAITSFKWSNLASNNAGVTCVVIGIEPAQGRARKSIITGDTVVDAETISPYMIPGNPIFVKARSKPISEVSEMLLGNFSKDGGHLICKGEDLSSLDEIASQFIRPMFGGEEFIKGLSRYCFWVEDDEVELAYRSPQLRRRFVLVAENRLASPKKATADWHKRPHKFVEVRSPDYEKALIVPIVSSESREYLPIGYLPDRSIVNYAFGLYDADLWNLSVLASKLHLAWVAAISGKLETRYRYSNTLCWNTFPLPKLTGQNKTDLTRCAENILLAREAHFPATIADMYDPDRMDTEFPDLRAAHERNDEVLERIYIGRRFRNDTERLEKLFELYTKLTAKGGAAGSA